MSGIRLYLLFSILIASNQAGADALAFNQYSVNPQQQSEFNFSQDDVEKALAGLERRLELFERDYEALLLKGLILFKVGQTELALEELESLTKKAPKFHLAHLVRADIQQSQLSVVDGFGSVPGLVEMNKDQKEQLNRLRDEANARLNVYLRQIDDKRIPAQLLLLGDTVKTAILVDKDRHRLYVYENPGDGAAPRLLRDFYSSTGKLIGDKRVRGDLKTPEGVYFVTSFKPDESLPDKYGIGAYPLNYPNELDVHLGQTGYGIWLHGTDKNYYSRPPLDSEGCVVLTNQDLDQVSPYIKPGITPVVIAQTVEWLEPIEWQNRKKELLSTLENWRLDWESLDVDRYLSHYSEEFWNRKHTKRSLSQYKRAVFSGKSYQKIKLHNISMFTYPTSKLQDKTMVVVNFTQNYESNNFNSHNARKRIYLAKDDNAWKLIYEGRQ
jgi:murein L,D-transpeptidase YafK